jgi:hypothetical protein
LLLGFTFCAFLNGTAFAQAKKPNILVIMGDDIGWYNPSIYHRGDMGYWTPNIDRVGKEGAMFHWDEPTDPIRIAGPLYFVGTVDDFDLF